MGTGYLLDTNTVIDFSAQKLPEGAYKNLSEIIDSSPQISIINRIELLSFTEIPQQILTFIEASLVIHLDKAIVLKTIALRKLYKIKLPDAIIAATAIIYDLTLITHNIADFQRINNIQLIDSHFI